jgi:2-octaprenyl-6-methoxyphenol hydroxylase
MVEDMLSKGFTPMEDVPEDDVAHGCDIAVVGLGPTGLVAALALAEIGADVAAVGPPPDTSRADTRTAALLTSSVDLLKALHVWDRLAPHAAPLEAIRIIDDSQSLLRAPDIEFRASELGLDAFGYNVANTALVDALYARAQEVLPAIIPANITGIALDERNALLSTSQGQRISTRLIAAADGRRSICRERAGIGITEHRHEQSALATSFNHSLPHENVSTELHKEHGSVTTVPLPEPRASSLIWVGTPAEIAQLARLDDAGFLAALSARLGGILGTLSSVGARATFPVAGLSADRLAAKRTVLIGEAAHILPPIGAQALNLGFRDAASLADCVADARARGGDHGGADVLGA